LIGEVLGNRYKLLRELGAGGMAWVYLAQDQATETTVAVKILYPQFNRDMSYVERFQREAKLAHQISNEHIVRILDYGADRDLYYLVMEQVQGKDLATILCDMGRLPWQEALRIGGQVALALEAANAHGIVHRDIKPQNIMVNAQGSVKVLDFGIARSLTLPTMTQGGMVGSPNYISPEQATGKPIDIRSDIYSLGVVLYEALSGGLPFDAKTAWSVIKQHVDDEPPSLSLRNDKLPAEVGTLVNKMLAKEPNDRYQTPTELVRAIQEIMERQIGPESGTFARTSVRDATQPVDQERTDSRRRAHQLLLSSLYNRATEAASSLEWPQAVNLFSRILTLDPDYEDVGDQLALATVQAQLAALYDRAVDALKDKRWTEAVDALSEIVGVDTGYRDAAELLTQAGMALSEFRNQEHLAHLYQDGLACLENKEWREAQAALSQVEEADPTYRDVTLLLAYARRRARWSESIVGRLSHSLGDWLHGPREQNPSASELEPRKDHERDIPTQT
jgi:serine/threonine protein kinase